MAALASGLEYIEVLSLGWPLVQAEQSGNSSSYSSLKWVGGGPMPTQAELDAWLPTTLSTVNKTVNGVTGVDMASSRIVYGTIPLLTSTSVIPADKTVPLITEGTQVFTVNVAPSAVNSRMVINLSFMTGCTSSKTITAALFRNGTCIAVGTNYISTSHWPVQLALHYVDTPVTTEVVTYTLRVGVNVSATWYIANSGTGSTAVTFNGTPTSCWSIMEI